MKIIIVGASPNKSFANKYHLNPSDYFIGLDAGNLEIIKRNIVPDIAIGDFDSTSEIALIKQKALQTLIYPSKKDETDLELAIKFLENLKGANNLKVEVYDVTGGRLDQEFNAYMLLRKYDNYQIKIIDNQNDVIFISRPIKHNINVNCKYFSIFAIEKSIVTIKNAEYELNETVLNINDTYTISNQPKGNLNPVVELNKGAIFLFCYYS